MICPLVFILCVHCEVIMQPYSVCLVILRTIQLTCCIYCLPMQPPHCWIITPNVTAHAHVWFFSEREILYGLWRGRCNTLCGIVFPNIYCMFVLCKDVLDILQLRTIYLEVCVMQRCILYHVSRKSEEMFTIYSVFPNIDDLLWNDPFQHHSHYCLHPTQVV